MIIKYASVFLQSAPSQWRNGRGRSRSGGSHDGRGANRAPRTFSRGRGREQGRRGDGKTVGPKIQLDEVFAADVAGVFSTAAQTEAAGTGDVHAATGKFASSGNAAGNGAQQHDVFGHERNSVRRQP